MGDGEEVHGRREGRGLERGLSWVGEKRALGWAGQERGGTCETEEAALGARTLRFSRRLSSPTKGICFKNNASWRFLNSNEMLLLRGNGGRRRRRGKKFFLHTTL